jgi:hypothetical protein
MDPLARGTDPRIRICTKMSRIQLEIRFHSLLDPNLQYNLDNKYNLVKEDKYSYKN